MDFSKYIRLPYLVLLISFTWLVLLFLFNPHYVELTGTLETWFPYKGLIYYKDFAAFHFPLGRIVLYPIHILSNWNLEVDPYLGLAVGVLNLLFIFYLCKKYMSITGLIFSLAFFSLIYWYAATGILYFHEQLIGLEITLLVFITVEQIVSKRTSKTINLISGLLVSATILTGQIALLSVGFILICQLLVNFFVKKFAKPTLFLTFGFAAPLLLTCIYFYLNDALWHLIEYNITYYFLYAGYQKDLLINLPRGQLFIFYLPTLLYFLLFIFTLLKKIRFGLLDYFFLTLSLTTVPFIIFSLYHPHHLNYALPIQAILFGFSINLLSKLQKSFLSIMFISLLFSYITYKIIVVWHFERVILPPDFRIQNDVYLNSEDPMNDAISWVKQNTDQNSRIMVLGDAMFFLRSNRLPASRPSKGIPYAWNPMFRIIDELNKQKTEYWIVDQNFLGKMLINYDRRDIYNYIKQELDNCYKLVVEFENWQIWQRDEC